MVDPICLSCRICECPQYNCEPLGVLPDCITAQFDGVFQGVTPSRVVYISLGLFTIDYCVPDKESVCTTDDPCELFKRIKFPTDEFFPPKLSDLTCEE